MSRRLSRKHITQMLLHLTPAQLGDLVLFRHHKKWTVPLMAMRLGVDQSTANRRLHHLVQQQVVDRLPGQYRVTGGRWPDLYYLTRLGARVLSRHLQLGSNYIEAPSAANTASNDHDLCVLEIAVRLGKWKEMRHRERMTFDCYEFVADSREETQFRKTGEQFVLVPDLMLPDDDHPDVYIEVEQTTRYQHIVQKHRAYEMLGITYIAKKALPWVYIIFGDEQRERMLLADHLRALSETENYLPLIGYANMDAIRREDVRTLDELVELVELISF
jgi:DNA-binding MarR family transcriptional regulator